MCGIAGFAGDFERDTLARMTAGLVHRGPDDSGEVVVVAGGARVGLGNRRLAIIDLSAAGHQPMTVHCPACGPMDAADESRLWLTFNGEIYNFPELRKQLEQDGHRFHSNADSEVLLHLYAQDGPAMLTRLNGIFALAIYDGRPSGQRDGLRPHDVLLARDGIGVKPLYYSASRHGVLFASEVKALLQCDDRLVERRLDPVAVSQYLAYQWVPAPRTVIESIRKVLPGQYLILRNAGIAGTGTFYELPVPATRSTGSLQDHAEALRHMLECAVSRQLLSDVPVGAFLSGGLDSSAVVAMVRRARPSYRLPCYTMSFPGESSTEGAAEDFPYAQKVASHLRVELIPVLAGPQTVDRLDEVLFALDEPTGDPAPVHAYLIAERARADGLKVLLSGTGGDDILAGYGRHLWLGLEPLWDRVPMGLRSAAARWAGRTFEHGLRPGSAHVARLIRLIGQLDVPLPLRLIERLQSTPAGLRAKLLAPAFRAAVPAGSDAAPLLETLSSLPPDTDALSMMLRLDQRHFLGDHNLNYLDKTTMAFGVEGRVPLLDLEFVRFAATIPADLKVSGRTGKYIFKKAMEPLLPRDVIYRSKTGFGAPLRRWMVEDLRQVVFDTLSPRAVRARGVFDADVVQKLMTDTHAGTIDGAQLLFSLFAFETWCRRVLDRQGMSVAHHGGPAAASLAAREV